MASGIGAGFGADMLQEILKRKFSEALANQQIHLSQQRLAQDAREADMRNSLATQGLDQRRNELDYQQSQDAAKTAAATQAQELAGNQAKLRGSILASQGMSGSGDPMGASATRNALRIVLAGSGAKQSEIPQETASTMTPVMRVNPRTGKMESLGDAPKGAHFVNEPPPPSQGPTHARFNIVQGADANGKPAMIRTNVDTGDIEVLPVPAGANFVKRDQPATADQTNLAIYASRVSQAEPTLKALEASVAAMNPLSYLAQTKIDNPAVQSKEMQQYQQAARQFINSVLRRESGAAISAGEFDSARKQYLPMPMDTPEVLAQKAAARADVLAQFQKAAGPAGQKPVSAAPAGNGPKRVKYDLNGNVIKD